MSLDFDDIAARGRPGRAFSNHTEYEMWEVNWCGRCLRDAPYRRMGKGSGCPILAVAVFHEVIPAEWLEQPEDHYPSDAFHCIEFRAPGGGGSGEPRPKPEPDQDGLFERPERAVRMFVQPQPAPISEPAGATP